MRFIRRMSVDRHRYFLFLFFGIFCLFLYVNTAGMGVNKRVKSRVSVYDTRCQDITNPVGIAELHPNFSWKIFSNKRAVIQTAYQITVSSSLQNIETDPDMWNSGKVNASENVFIYYKGRPLESGKKYYWKVKIWVNNEPRNFEARPSDFVTGLLQKNEWEDTKWIAYKKLPDSMKVFPGLHGNGNQLGNKAMERAVIPYFRKDFQISKQIAHAYVFACGLGQYVLYVNGQRIDSTFLNPTWSDYTKRCYYNSYDITPFIKDGENTIASIVGPGFLYINRERYRKLTIAAGYPMMRLKMIIRYVDGSTQEVVTDQSWKTSPSAITYSSIYGGEDFNANKIKKGWNKPGFNDTNWQIPVIVPGPGGKMDAQEAYAVVINKKFQPVKIDSSKSKIWLYDFGQNTSGIIRLKASAPKGYRIEIIPAELINKDQSPDQTASGYPYYWEYTFNGNGIEKWQPLFSYYGFRYAGVKVFDKEGNPISVNNVNISSLTSLHTQNSSPKVGTFSCSDTLFNQVFELIRWGIRNNMSNVSTDCPHREKLGWLEQAHLMGNSIQYNYDILRFYVKIIKDMEDLRGE